MSKATSPEINITNRKNTTVQKFCMIQSEIEYGVTQDRVKTTLLKMICAVKDRIYLKTNIDRIRKENTKDLFPKLAIFIIRSTT